MRTLFMAATFLVVTACVQDQGTVSNGAASSSGTTSGGSSGGTSGGTSGGSQTDPLYAYQWHLKNSGQDIGAYVNSTLNLNYNPTSGFDINVEDVHDSGDGYTGAGVTIAVSDTGTDYTHPDLDGNFVSSKQRNYSFVDPARWDDANADSYPSGNQPHGTEVAGIIAMEGWNGIGGRGVAPGASFTAFKYILSDTALDHYSSQEDKDIHQMNAQVDIFSYSYGYDQNFFYNDYDTDILAALRSGVTTLRSNKGALYVQAAGNSYLDYSLSSATEFVYAAGNTNVTSSLSYPEKILVAAVNAKGEKSSYSTPGSGVWISAFGGEGFTYINVNGNYVLQYTPAIFTTDIQDCSSGSSYRDAIMAVKNPFNYAGNRTLNPTCDYTNEMNGTSSATPMTSGVIALMLEANPALTWREVKYILASTARVIDYDPLLNELDHPDGVSTFAPYVYDYKWITNAAGKMFSNWYGFGLIDAEAAVAAAAAWTPGSLGTYQKTELADGTWKFTSAATVAITDGDLTAPGSSTINVTDNLTIEAVQVKLTSDHPYPEQLAVHITSPSGTVSRLILVNSGVAGTDTTYYFQSNAFLDETSAGVWTIEVYDPSDLASVTGDSGSITGWAINIHGH